MAPTARAKSSRKSPKTKVPVAPPKPKSAAATSAPRSNVLAAAPAPAASADDSSAATDAGYVRSYAICETEDQKVLYSGWSDFEACQAAEDHKKATGHEVKVKEGIVT